jgi:pyruvate dehydrogenase E2 component (dihydrolipoamide acetyltransferase)
VDAQVVLPQSGLEVEEASVVALHVAAGDRVAAGDVLLEVETDKALSEIVAPAAGTVAEVLVAEGDTVAVGTLLVRLDGEVPVAAAGAGGGASTVRAAPVARRAAARMGIDLEGVAGTGPRGRITLRDVERIAEPELVAEPAPEPAAAPPAPDRAPPPDHGRLEPLDATRRAIAARMADSQRIPQFALRREIDASWLLAEKDRLAGAVRLTLTDLLVQALAVAVAAHPGLAAAFVEDAGDGRPALRHPGGVHVGLAVATPRGLRVAVLRDADRRTLGDLSRERAGLVAAARDRGLPAEAMAGATVTLSNLGPFGVDSFTAMLEPGTSAILAVGRTVERVVPAGRGVTIVPTLALSLTLDHRAVDGATGAAALGALAELLEGAMAWRP